MSLLHKARMEKKFATYMVGSATCLVDPLWQTRAQDYRRSLSGRMIPLDASDIRKRLPPATYHTSVKVDGEFNIMIVNPGEAITVNPGGTVRTGLKLHDEAAAILKAAGIKKAVLAGEFYYQRPDGKRPRVHDVSRVARQPANAGELEALRFAVFDVIELEGKPMPGFGEAEWKTIIDWFGQGHAIHPVETLWLNDIEAIEKQFQLWVAGGAEGAVVRSESAGQFKLKPRHTLDAVVIGFTEGTDDRTGMVHDLLLALMRPEGTLHILGRVGGGMTEDDRRAFLSDLKDLTCASDYAEVNDQIAYTMVRPEWVIEVSILDLLSQSTRGEPISRMVLDWNSLAKKYEIVRRMPLVGMISPQFVRRRDDKRLHVADLKLSQVTDLVDVPFADKDSRLLVMAKSEVLKRDVYTKVLKGQTMVRKLIMWQTNKVETNDYPAYVIHFTDYSPGRKTPLERDARISNSREQIEQLWNDMVTENIVKGWVKFGDASVAATAVAPDESPDEKPAPKKRAPAKKKPKDPETE